MHEVQTFIRLRRPGTLACTVWMFGFHRRRVRRWEWDTLLPKPGPLPQTSHTLATEISQVIYRQHGPSGGPGTEQGSDPSRGAANRGRGAGGLSYQATNLLGHGRCAR